MKTSNLLTISEDLSLIFSIEKIESLNDHYTIGIQTVDNLRSINNKLQITMDSNKLEEFFEALEKLKCNM